MPALLAILLLLASACASPGRRGAYEDYPVSFPEMVRMLAEDGPHLLPHQGCFGTSAAAIDGLRTHRSPPQRCQNNPDGLLAAFERLGPFETRTRTNIALAVGGGVTITADLALPRGDIEAPLAIIVHGNQSQKEAHRFQAQRLASFGIYALSVQVPSRDQWTENGKIIERLTRALRKNPALLHRYVDTRNIVLIGHSFGASAITVAASRGAPVRGLVLLDPAVYDKSVMKAMRAVKQPVMLLGADLDVFRARKRPLFYRNMGGAIAELSVVGATHDDAQHPSMFALSAYGLDPWTSRERQEIFSASITATVMSLVTTGGLDYAWTAFGDALARGELKDARRRDPRRLAPKEQE